MDNKEHYFRYKWFALIGLSLMSSTAFLDFTIVSTAIPFIQQTFKANMLQLQWVNSIFAMMCSMFMVGMGKLGDLYDRRLVFYSGFLIFALAAVGAALSPSIQWLIACRGLQGLAVSIIVTQSPVLLPQAFPEEEQHVAISIYSAITGLGLAIGPVLGGFIINSFSWRYVFWFNIPLIIIGFACCIFTLRSKPVQANNEPFDWWGMILLIIAVGSIIYGVVLGGQIGWGSVLTIVYIVAGIFAFIGLLIRESHTKYPLLDSITFTSPYAILAITICSCAGIITNIFLFLDPIFFKVVQHLSAKNIGFLLVAMPAAQICVAVLFPKIIKATSISFIIVIGIIFSVVAVIMNSFFLPTMSIWLSTMTFVFMGITWGLSNTCTIHIINSHFSANKAGSIIGTIFTFWNLCGAVFLAAATVIFNQFQKSHLNNFIQQNPNYLSEQEHSHLLQALQDPDHASSYLHSTDGAFNHLYDIFQSGFVDALSNTSWVVFIILFVILLIALQQLRKLR